MFCGLDRPSRAICAACPVRFRSYGRLSFRRTMPFFWAKKMRPWGLFGNPMATVFFLADFWRFSTTIRSGWHHLWSRFQVDWAWLSYLSCGIQRNPLAPAVLDAEALCRVGHVRPNLQTRESPLCRVGSSTQVDFWIKVSSKPVRFCVTHVGNPNDI